MSGCGYGSMGFEDTWSTKQGHKARVMDSPETRELMEERLWLQGGLEREQKSEAYRDYRMRSPGPG